MHKGRQYNEFPQYCDFKVEAHDEVFEGGPCILRVIVLMGRSRAEFFRPREILIETRYLREEKRPEIDILRERLLLTLMWSDIPISIIKTWAAFTLAVKKNQAETYRFGS